MSFRRSDLQEAFFVPGTHAFRVWGYGTTDPLEEVLGPDYFEPSRGQLRPGELMYVSCRSPAEGRNGATPVGIHMALVVVGADERDPERAAGTVHLVHDLGRASAFPRTPGMHAPTEVATVAPPVPPKRGRGRPRGSGNKKLAEHIQVH